MWGPVVFLKLMPERGVWHRLDPWTAENGWLCTCQGGDYEVVVEGRSARGRGAKMRSPRPLQEGGVDTESARSVFRGGG
jgi:hypothetical protein